MVEDIGAHMGMLVTTVGFTPAAKRRATNMVQEVIPMVDVVLLNEAPQLKDESRLWMVRAGQSGRYAGEYVDHEPYGAFWWVVRFAPSGSVDDEEVIWSSSEGGWDGRELGPRLLASVLARHRLARNPDPEELDNVTAAVEHLIEDGQGFVHSTEEIDRWLDGDYED